MKKGQIISLDFIMSLVLLVLAVGLVLQLSEIENYNFKDKELKDDTQIMGKTAANNLVNSPKLVCELVDFRDQNTVLSYMSNCLPDFNFTAPYTACGGSETACKTWDKYGNLHRTFKPLLKEFLGLPEDYSCFIKVTGGKVIPTLNAALLSDCEISPPALAKNVYAIDLNVVFHNKVNGTTGKTLTVDKNEFEQCRVYGPDGIHCNLYPATIKFMVWKND